MRHKLNFFLLIFLTGCSGVQYPSEIERDGGTGTVTGDPIWELLVQPSTLSCNERGFRSLTGCFSRVRIQLARVTLESGESWPAKDLECKLKGAQGKDFDYVQFSSEKTSRLKLDCPFDVSLLAEEGVLHRAQHVFVHSSERCEGGADLRMELCNGRERSFVFREEENVAQVGLSFEASPDFWRNVGARNQFSVEYFQVSTHAGRPGEGIGGLLDEDLSLSF